MEVGEEGRLDPEGGRVGRGGVQDAVHVEEYDPPLGPPLPSRGASAAGRAPVAALDVTVMVCATFQSADVKVTVAGSAYVNRVPTVLRSTTTSKSGSTARSSARVVR